MCEGIFGRISKIIFKGVPKGIVVTIPKGFHGEMHQEILGGVSEIMLKEVLK